MASTCVVGSTGLVGSHILTVLANQAEVSSIHAFSRRELPGISTKISTIIESQSTSWPNKYPERVDIFFSALGTTARIAGSFAKQREIDYDANLAMAKAALARKTKIYVLISTTGADPSSRMPYTQMKGELDEAVKTLGFEHTIILKPGLLVGTRQDSRPGEFMGRSMASFLGAISRGKLKDGWAVDADVVAKAAVAAGLEAMNGVNRDKVRVLNHSEVIRLGRSGVTGKQA